MKIVAIDRPGGPEVLTLREQPMPSAGDDEVLIQIAAAGLNHADLLQRKGKYPPPPGAPAWPGMEVSGTVAAVGTNVHEFKLGDRVCALLPGGGYAEYCAAHAGQVLPIPGNLDFVRAAALPEAYFTVWSNVFGLGQLRQGEVLLVHGGASGIGVAAIQLAVTKGCVVLATAGSDEKCRFCESLGAVRAINYRTEDFVVEAAAATQGRGVDVILDMVGGDYVSRNLASLATQGRLVMIATQGGVKGEVDVLRIMQRRLTLTGSTLRGRSVEFKAQVRSELLEHVWPLIASGAIRPIVDRVFPLEAAAAAHEYMEQGRHTGKIILDMDT